MIVRCLLAAAVLAEVFAVAQQEKLQALDRVLEIVAEVAEYLVARSIFLGPTPGLSTPSVVKSLLHRP